MTYLISISCVINAWVYVNVLIKPGHILAPWFKFLGKIFTTTILMPRVDPPKEVLEDPEYQKMISDPNYKPPAPLYQVKRSWILKPLGDCIYCTTGQLTLWAVSIYLFLPDAWPQGVDIIWTAWSIVTSICFSILLVEILDKMMKHAAD